MQGAGVQGVLLIALGTVTETSEPYPLMHCFLCIPTIWSASTLRLSFTAYAYDMRNQDNFNQKPTTATSLVSESYSRNAFQWSCAYFRYKLRGQTGFRGLVTDAPWKVLH